MKSTNVVDRTVSLRNLCDLGELGGEGSYCQFRSVTNSAGLLRGL